MTQIEPTDREEERTPAPERFVRGVRSRWNSRWCCCLCCHGYGPGGHFLGRLRQIHVAVRRPVGVRTGITLTASPDVDGGMSDGYVKSTVQASAPWGCCTAAPVWR